MRGDTGRAQDPAPVPLTLAQRTWRWFCRGVVWVFYRRVEVAGATKIPTRGPVVLVANHLNALADAVILQAVWPRFLHPLARSGLFRNPWLRPLLAFLQAVPIYRPQDQGSDPSRNVDSFVRCYELLAQGEVLLIFPEGQSHSDPHLRPLKTGAARIILGAQRHSAVVAKAVPVGLSFTRKGKFRSRVLVEVGDPVEPVLETAGARRGSSVEPSEEDVRRLTSEISGALAEVTLNLDSWEDLDLLWRLERFFAFRRGRRPHLRSLSHRFRALRRLVETHRRLRHRAPEEVLAVRRKLEHFERLLRACGVKDYHLQVRYTGTVILRYVGRGLVFLLGIPLGLWGLANSALPFYLTRHLSRRSARGVDQYDSAKILLGLALFLSLWGFQTMGVWWLLGPLPATGYFVSLPLTSAFALALARQKNPLLENLRVFFLFSRRRELRRHLLTRRQEVERELARLARLSKKADVVTGEVGPRL